MRRLLIILALLACGIRADAAFSKSYKITVDHTKAGGSNSATFVMWFCVNGSAAPCDSGAHSGLAVTDFKASGSGGVVTSSNGYDVVFGTAAGCSSRLSFELEKYKAGSTSYDGTTGFGSWFVQIGTLSSSVDTDVYVCLGDATITTDQSATATYTADSNFLRAYHLAPLTNDLTTGIQDSTGLGVLMAWGGLPTAGSYLNGSNAGVGSAGRQDSTGTETGLPAGSTPWTLSGWFKTSISAEKWLFDVCQLTDNSHCIGLVVNHSAGKASIHAAGWRAVSTTSVNDGNWHYIVGSSNGVNENKIYVDGVLEGTDATLASTTVANTVTTQAQVADGGFWLCTPCQSDETRIRNDYIAAARVTADYNNQSRPDLFYTITAAAVAIRHRVISQ